MRPYVFITFIFFLSYNTYGQLGPSEYYDNVYVVDTIHLSDPVSVLFVHNYVEIGLITEKRNLNLISGTPKSVLKNNNIYIDGGTYYLTPCDIEEADIIGNHLVQEFVTKPDYFLLLLVKIQAYIDTNSSIDNNLKYYFPKKTRHQFIKVLVAGCPTEEELK